MKLTNAKIIVKSMESTKEEWKKALKGEINFIQSDDQIIFTSFDTVSKVFSKTRMVILKTVIEQKPESIYELAKILNRDFKNVHTDVKFLSQVGLIDLEDSGKERGGLRPVAKFSGIELDFAA